MSAMTSAVVFARRENAEPAPGARALRRQLEALREVIATMAESVYRSLPSRVSGSVGAHVRHCLDHVRSLLSFVGSDELTYDARLRGTAIETDPRAALEEIDRLCLELEDLRAENLDQPVRLRSMTERDGTGLSVKTTLGRELAFVIQHTIHHAAIIAVLLDGVQLPVPSRFGYAPSTPR